MESKSNSKTGSRWDWAWPSGQCRNIKIHLINSNSSTICRQFLLIISIIIIVINKSIKITMVYNGQNDLVTASNQIKLFIRLCHLHWRENIGTLLCFSFHDLKVMIDQFRTTDRPPRRRPYRLSYCLWHRHRGEDGPADQVTESGDCSDQARSIELNIGLVG